MNRKEKQAMMLVKKPKKKWLPVEQNSMELSPVFNTSKGEQKKGAARRELGKGKYIEISKNVKGELIQFGDLSTFLGCFLFLKHSQRRKRGCAFETSYYKFLSTLGERTGGRDYEKLKKSLDRLNDNRITTNFWWNTISGERVILSKFYLINSIQIGEGKEKGKLRITLNRDIVKSMEHGYLRWLEENKLKEILHLRGNAKILTLFLLKQTNSGPGLKYSLEKIMDILGVREKYGYLPKFRRNENIKRYVIPAIEKAANTIGYGSKYYPEEKIFRIWKERKSLTV